MSKPTMEPDIRALAVATMEARKRVRAYMARHKDPFCRCPDSPCVHTLALIASDNLAVACSPERVTAMLDRHAELREAVGVLLRECEGQPDVVIAGEFHAMRSRLRALVSNDGAA